MLIRSLGIAKTGLEAQQLKMDVTTNNLAHVSTNGFKRSRAIFEDLLYQNLRQPGAQTTQQNTLPSGLQVGTGVRAVATQRDFREGDPEATNNDYDVMIDGDGFFQVALPSGETGYTRNVRSRSTRTASSSPPPATSCSRRSRFRPAPRKSSSAPTAPCP
jgi:flagellar basal-body rod protein FlgG